MNKFYIASLLVICFLTTINTNSFGQVKIGPDSDLGTPADPSAVLELKASDKGFLLPRISDTLNIANPTRGLMIYNTTVECVQQYDGVKWECLDPEEKPDFSELVFVNDADPNLADTFRIEVDSIYDDPALETNTNYLYAGTDGSGWIWDGTQYVTTSSPNRTEWYYSGTRVDAGPNKNGSISRPGNVGFGPYASGSWQTYTRKDPSNYGAAYIYARENNTAYTNYGLYVYTGADISSDQSNIGIMSNAYSKADVRHNMGAYNYARLDAGATASLYNVGTFSLAYAYGHVESRNAALWGNAFPMSGSVIELNNYGIRVNAAGREGSRVMGHNYAGYFYSSTQGRVDGNTYAGYFHNIPHTTANANTIDRNYGIYVVADDRNNKVAGTSNEWVIYATSGSTLDESRNYFRDRTGIGTAAPTAKLSVNGTANKTGGGAWAVFSDAGLKENVTPYEEGLELIKKVNTVNFQYNDEFSRIFGEQPRGAEGKVFQGVIAQELEQIAPDMVREVEVPIYDEEIDEETGDIHYINNEKYEKVLEVDPNKFTYALINAVQELSESNEKKDEEINELKAKLAAILAALEANDIEVSQ